MLNNFGFLGSADAIPKRICPIFLLIDTSGSMEGARIGAINSAIEEIIPDLRELSNSQADSEVRLAILEFSSGCEWVTPRLMSMDSFDDWVPLQANGLTDLGEAFLELNRKLSKTGFMDRDSASSGFYAPVIMLLSDGDPTDDWLGALRKLQENKWYQASLRVALAIGEDPNLDVLKKFIRNPELLFHVTDISQLKKVVRFIAVTSSQVASTSAAITEETARIPANSKDVSPTSTENTLIGTLHHQEPEEPEYFSSSSMPSYASRSQVSTSIPQSAPSSPFSNLFATQPAASPFPSSSPFANVTPPQPASFPFPSSNPFANVSGSQSSPFPSSNPFANVSSSQSSSFPSSNPFPAPASSSNNDSDDDWDDEDF